MSTRTQGEGAVTPQRTDSDLPVSVQGSLVEVWVNSGRVRGTEYSSTDTRYFEGDCHYLHYHHHSLVSDQTTGREYSPAHQQKIGLKIY